VSSTFSSSPLYDPPLDRLKVFDTSSFMEVSSSSVASNCVNSVSFHPYSSLMIVSSGERVFHLNEDEDSNSSDEDNESLPSQSSNLPSCSEIMICKYSRHEALPAVGVGEDEEGKGRETEIEIDL
jgi:hypothetical protein